MKTDQPTPPASAEKSIVEFAPYGTQDKITLSIEIVKRLIAVKTKSGKTASDEDAFKFMLMCQARRLNPFEGDAFLVGYDGAHGASFSLITSHQAFLKRAELHPEFDGMDSGTIVLRDGKVTELIGDWHMPNDKILGGWAIVHFKNRKHPMQKRVRLERFNKGYGIWRDDPAGMVVKCAEADALRSSFPTMLGGMFTQEEMGAPAQTADIPKPVFAAETVTTANGGAVTLAPVDETPRTPPVDEPKKKPTLQRKSASRLTEPARAPESNHDKLKKLLAVGNVTPEDFVSMLLDEGWIEAEQGTWEQLREEQCAEFLKPENFQVVSEVLEERKAKAARSTPAAESGQLL
jgi:phage recombination protein Bet